MPDDTAHVLYRFYSSTGQLLYVGITMNPPQRFKSHRDSKEWWSLVSGITVENYGSREELAKAERRAIQIEHPLHNVVHAKGKHRQPEPQPQPDPPVPTQPSLADEGIVAQLFGPSKPIEPSESFGLDRLFSPGRLKETRYGYLTDEEFEARAAEKRAKLQACRECPFCHGTAYRNGYLCDHKDHSQDGDKFGQAQWRLKKERLRSVGGDA